MKKLIKLVLKIAVVLVILLVGAVVTLRLMFPPEKLKAMALEYAKNNLHREITFDDVSLNLVGVTLDNFAISEATTFKNGTFAKAEKLVVKIALKPLFEKRIEIATVQLDGLDVNVIKQKDGSFNFDSLIPASDAATAAKPEQTQQSSAFVLTAEKIAATNCDFYYKDLQTGMSASLEKLNLEIDQFDMANPFGVKINFTTGFQEQSGPAVSLPIKIDVKASLADLDLTKAYATINSISASYKNMTLKVWGGIKNFSKPEINLQGKITGINNQTFADFVPNLPSFSMPDISFASDISADLDKSSAVIRTAKLSVLDSYVSASGNAAWGAQVTYRVNAAVNLMLGQITKMTNMLDAFGLGGSITGNLAATEKNNGADVRGSITLSNVAAKYEPVSVSALNGTIAIASADDISSPSLTGLLNGEKFTSSFSYKNVRDVMNIVFNLDLAKLTLASFPSSGAPAQQADQPQGQTQTAKPASSGPETYMNVKADIKVGPISVPYFRADGFSLNANLTNVSESMKRTNGQVAFMLQPGAITNLDSFVKESKIVNILLLPISIVRRVAGVLNVDIFPTQDPAKKGEISFNSGEGVYTFTNGVMQIEKTTFNSKLTNIVGAGNINFNTEALDMQVAATVLTSQTPIVIKIGGTLNEPKGKLDVVSTVGSVLGGILNYKTPGKVITGSANLAGDVATGAVKTTGKVAGVAVKTGVDVTKSTVGVATGTVKGTVNVAKDALKGLGGLFKKTEKDVEKETK